MSQNITLLENDKVINVTKRTVRFSRTVYQTKNIAEFGEGEVDMYNISWSLIFAVIVIGSAINTVITNGSVNAVGGSLITFGIIGALYNWFKPSHYGLLISLNSGDKKLFVTSDKSGLKQVISTIYDFIETEAEATYQISISHSQVSGNFIQGDVGGSVAFESDS